MNPVQSRQLIKDTFTQSFDKARFHAFAINLLNHVDEGKAFRQTLRETLITGKIPNYAGGERRPRKK